MVNLNELNNDRIMEMAIENVLDDGEFNAVFTTWVEEEVKNYEIENFEKDYDAKFKELYVETDGDVIDIDFDYVKIGNVEKLASHYDIELELPSEVLENVICRCDNEGICIDTNLELEEEDLDELSRVTEVAIEELYNEINNNANYSLDYYTETDILEFLEQEGIEVLVYEETGEIDLYK